MRLQDVRNEVRAVAVVRNGGALNALHQLLAHADGNLRHALRPGIGLCLFHRKKFV